MPAKRSATAGNVDDYLSLVPQDKRIALESLRKIIKAAAHGTTEVVSYKIPIFKYEGHPLVGFGATENRWSFYVMSSSMIPKLARMRTAELKGYEVSGATIHLTSLSPPRS